MKVLVAMSGGVDSSVAAYLLKEQGHEVIGLSFELWDQRDTKNPNICCSLETIQIARDVAEKLGIKHYTTDVRDSFYRDVIEEFCSLYISGVTPNPCILCNKFIKFKALLNKAAETGADLVATGHYARIDPVPFGTGQAREPGEQSTDNKRFLLKKGVDPKKDQSYVLYVMTQEELSKTVFPLGELKKDETRNIAAKLGLASALRPESQEICFVGDGNYTDFVRDFAPEALQRGPVVDTQGKVVGEHKGIAFYTIGQRKRLGIQTLKPHYVVDINRQKNMVIVGSRAEAEKKSFIVKELNWISMDAISKPFKARAKIRSTMKEQSATLIPEENQKVRVEFDEPQWAPTPGQSAVFYDKDVVIGGGIIE
ncbi:tRNA-specific 2-thiouridylase MnmA [bacterium BMS3Abin10]|nr:tRNA-specific 2-thiouridylase MnmA [bacterium BMS3Abin10]